MHEQQRHRLADNVAAAKDGGVGALDGNVTAAQNFHAPSGSAGYEPGAPADEAAKTHGMETVDVFRGIDCFEDTLGVDLGRKRELHENAVHLVVAVQAFDERKQLKSGHRGRRRDELARQTEFFASRDFALYVELRSGILADENRSKARPHAGRREKPDFVFQFGDDLPAYLVAVEDSCGHAQLAFALLA